MLRGWLRLISRRRLSLEAVREGDERDAAAFRGRNTGIQVEGQVTFSDVESVMVIERTTRPDIHSWLSVFTRINVS